jgi:hypothetical protein
MLLLAGVVEFGAVLFWGEGDGVRTERTESGVEASDLIALVGVTGASSSWSGRFCGIGAIVGSSMI